MQDRIYLLDAGRGIAASVVLFHHLFVNFKRPFEHLRSFSEAFYQVARFISELNTLAVLFFFVISGFCIHLSACRLNMLCADDIKIYFYKRFRRLLPLYYLSLVLTIMVGWVANRYSSAYSIQELVGNLLFLQTPASVRGIWFVPYGQNYPLWSLSFEMFFYICYPVLSRYLYYKNSGNADYQYTGAIIASCFSALGFILYNLLPNPLALFSSHFLIWYAGVLVAEFYLRKTDAQPAFWILCILSLAAWLLSITAESETIAMVASGLLISWVWISFLAMPAAIADKLVIIIKPIILIFAPLGFCSYAIYLFQQPLIHLFLSLNLNSYMDLILAPISCIILAALAEYLLSSRKYAASRPRYART